MKESVAHACYIIKKTWKDDWEEEERQKQDRFMEMKSIVLFALICTENVALVTTSDYFYKEDYSEMKEKDKDVNYNWERGEPMFSSVRLLINITIFTQVAILLLTLKVRWLKHLFLLSEVIMLSLLALLP